MQRANLFHHNLKVLTKFLRPSVIELLNVFVGSKYEVIGSAEGGDLNFLSPEGLFYQPNALVSGYMQAQDFINNPQQIRMGNNLDISVKQNNLASEYNYGLKQDVIEKFPLEAPEFNEVACLVCLGIGAGFHLPFLTSKLKFKEIIFLEPDFELFFNSLKLMDWRPIAEQIESRGGRLTFLFENDPTIAHAAIVGFMRDKYYGFVEGSYIYQHYKNPVFKEVQTSIVQSGSDLLSYNGWMEDDILHLTNHIANFHSRDFLLLDNTPSVLDSTLGPAVVVGSGPSLNESIGILKQHRNEITIFSCGTSLGPLLANGIYPDFHCELENVSIVSDFISQLAESYSLDNITLVASSTITPAAARLFKKGLFFVREGDGAMSIVNPEITQLDNVGPSATNTAVRVAAQLGFSNICLFGTDFGAIKKEKEYAAGVVYKDLKTINKAIRLKGGNPLVSGGSAYKSLATVVKGNFGNLINTNSLLLDMKNRMELSIFESSSEIYNCSGGASIRGAKPCDELELSKLILNFPKKKALSTTHFNSITPVKIENIHKIGEALRQYFTSISNELGSLVNNSKSKVSINELYEVLSNHMFFEYTEFDNSFQRAIRSMISGSLMKAFHVVRYYYCRSGHLKHQFLKHAITKFLGFIPLFEANSFGFIDHTLASLGYDAGRGCDEKQNFAVYFVQGEANFSWKYSHNVDNFFSQDDEVLREILNDVIADDTTSSYILTYLFLRIANNQKLHEKHANDQHMFMLKLLQRISEPNSRLLGEAATYLCFGGHMDLALKLTQTTKKVDQLPGREVWNLNMLILNGNVEEAYKTSLNLPDYNNLPNIINLTAFARYIMGHVDDAMSYLEEQIQNPDATGSSLYFKSFLQERLGETELAEMSLRNAQERFPGWERRADFLFKTVFAL